MNVSGIWDLNEQKVEEFLYLLVFIWNPRSESWPIDRTGKKIDKIRQKLHALECATGYASWICNDWTAGLMIV